MKKRKDGMYERKVKIPLEDGTFIRKSFYNADKRLLDIQINEIQNQINKGTYVLENDSTFEQAIKKWFKVHAASKEETTKESYGIYMNHAIRLLGKKKLQEIKPSDVKEAYNNFLFKLDEQGNKVELHSKNSLKHLHTTVNMAFKLAIGDGLLHKNPCDALNKKEMKPDEFEPYVYSEDEFNTLLEKIRGTVVEVVVLLAGGVGLRAGEICGLKWKNIDYENNQITINTARYRANGKTGEKKTKSKNRTIYVDPYIIQVLKSRPNGSQYVVCRSTQEPYRNDEIYHLFVEALDYYGLPKTRLHDLRHYNATMMAHYGVDIKTAANRLGDDPVTVLRIYQHAQDKADKSAAEKLGSMFKKDKPVVRNVVKDKKERASVTTDVTGNPTLN